MYRRVGPRLSVDGDVEDGHQVSFQRLKGILDRHHSPPQESRQGVIGGDPTLVWNLRRIIRRGLSLEYVERLGREVENLSAVVRRHHPRRGALRHEGGQREQEVMVSAP